MAANAAPKTTDVAASALEVLDHEKDDSSPKDTTAVETAEDVKAVGDGKSIPEAANAAAISTEITDTGDAENVPQASSAAAAGIEIAATGDGESIPQASSAVAASTEIAATGGHGIDLLSWPGWVELESEPAYFNTLLKEIGVSGIRVQELFDLEQEAMASLPKPCHALIFLFKYIGSDKDESDEDVPDDIWFARQVAPNACATQALMNIIMNIPGLTIGDQLAGFKMATSDMTPTERGDELDQLHFVRAVHNSFATENDIIAVDQIYQKEIKANHKRAAAAKVDKAKKRKLEEDDTDFEPSKRSRKASAIAAKTKRDSTGSTSTQKSGHSARAQRQQHRRRSKAITTTEAAYHYCAYMPIGNRLWMLDGLQPGPEDLGAVADKSNWLDTAIPALNLRIAEYAADAVEFCLMAIVHDEAKSGDSNEDTIDAERVVHRRHDYASFVRGWMAELHESGQLDELLQAPV